MPIDKEIFAQQMALLAGRIGRNLEAPIFACYYSGLSAELSTERFVAAMTIAFRSWSGEFRTWPSPKQIIELIAPVPNPTLPAHEAFEKVLAITNDPRIERPAQLEQIQNLGALTMRAFRAAGGFRDFQNILEADIPWVRRRFVEAFTAATETAIAESQATLALEQSDEKTRGLIAQLAKAKQMPDPRAAQQRITEKAS
jgi:hypothetical protein